MTLHLLVGTRKGALIYSAETDRTTWQVSDLLFAGWMVQHFIADPRDGTLYIVVDHDVWGPHVHRSADFGATWEKIDPPQQFNQAGDTHKTLWHVQPGHADRPGELWLGGAPGVLYRSADRGDSWEPVLGINAHPTRNRWFEGAAGKMVHSIRIDPADADRMYVAISVAGVFRSDDGGVTWHPHNDGTIADFLPNQTPKVGQCSHHLVLGGAVPDLLYQQNHCGVYRSEDGGVSWIDCNDGLPARFGFPIGVLPHKPQTIFVVPQISPDYRYVPEGKFRVYRSRNGGDSWDTLTNGLPQDNAYLTVNRQAMATDGCDAGGVYVGTGEGHLFATRDEGDRWETLAQFLPPIYSLETYRRIQPEPSADDGLGFFVSSEPVGFVAEVAESEPEPAPQKSAESRETRMQRRLKLQRSRRYTEPLYEDERLRDNLYDTNAQTLIDWATAQIEATASETIDASRDDADAALAETSARVRSAMRQVNWLLGRHRATQQLSAAELHGLLKAFCDEFSLDATAAELQTISNNYHDLNRDALFRTLFAWLNGREDSQTVDGGDSAAPHGDLAL